MKKNSFYIPTQTTREEYARDLRYNSFYRDAPAEEFPPRKKKPLWLQIKIFVWQIQYLIKDIFRGLPK